jgi:hypothetical protein
VAVVVVLVLDTEIQRRVVEPEVIAQAQLYLWLLVRHTRLLLVEAVPHPIQQVRKVVMALIRFFQPLLQPEAVVAVVAVLD